MKMFIGGKLAPTKPNMASQETLPSYQCTSPSPPGQGTPHAVCPSRVWRCGVGDVWVLSVCECTHVSTTCPMACWDYSGLPVGCAYTQSRFTRSIYLLYTQHNMEVETQFWSEVKYFPSRERQVAFKWVLITHSLCGLRQVA